MNTKSISFNYKGLRFLVGLIAMLLPIFASLLSGCDITSISASYCGNGRDVFVGMLFIVGAIMSTYNGHDPDPKYVISNIFPERIASRIAAAMAIITALCHAKCNLGYSKFFIYTHWAAATILFFVLIYFSLCFFERARNKVGIQAKVRARIYIICCIGMCACILLIGIFSFPWFHLKDLRDSLRIIYWGEAFALEFFGFSWFIASQLIPGFYGADEEPELLRALFKRPNAKRGIVGE